MNNHLKLGRALPADAVGDALADCYQFLLRQMEPPKNLAHVLIINDDTATAPWSSEISKNTGQHLQAVEL